MTLTHWQIMAASAAFTALILFLSFRFVPNTRTHKMLERGVCAALTLFMCNTFLPASPGLNLLTLSCVSVFGAPGLALLFAVQAL